MDILKWITISIASEQLATGSTTILKEHAHDKEKVIVVSNNMGITNIISVTTPQMFTLDISDITTAEPSIGTTALWQTAILMPINCKMIYGPQNTIHTIDVDGKPVGAVIKRENKDDYWGYMAKLEADQIAENNEEKAEKIITAIEHLKPP